MNFMKKCPLVIWRFTGRSATFGGNRLCLGIIVIRCSVYISSLMSDRARLSKIDSWTSSSSPGLHFLGSKYFPTSLTDAVQEYDPAGLFMAQLHTRTHENYTRIPSYREKENLLEKFVTGKGDIEFGC